MSLVPHDLRIYHITHGRNLAGIVADGGLWSDEEMTRRGGPGAAIGMPKIKKRRLEELAVHCHPGTRVGQYVPFYFCPRSVMLYILHKANHPHVAYKGGQRPILHLEFDLREVVTWADTQGRNWAFTDRNAGSQYFRAFRDLKRLDELGWDDIANRDFRDSQVMDAKQAEFLVFGMVPWTLVRTIGVIDDRIAARVRELVPENVHRPDVRVKTEWYY